jgi:hypothetical protein
LPSLYRHLAGDLDRRDMPNPDETYIVRVRRDEGDAVVEDVRSPRSRRHVRNLSELGALINDWLEPGSGGRSRPPQAPGRPERKELS